MIEKSKGLKVTAARPLILAAEENLHKMVVDLDKVVSKVGPWLYAVVKIKCGDLFFSFLESNKPLLFHKSALTAANWQTIEDLDSHKTKRKV